MDNRLFDKRVIRRNLDKGAITLKDYQKHIEGLPDATSYDVLDIPLYQKGEKRVTPVDVPQSKPADTDDRGA